MTEGDQIDDSVKKTTPGKRKASNPLSNKNKVNTKEQDINVCKIVLAVYKINVGMLFAVAFKST